VSDWYPIEDAPRISGLELLGYRYKGDAYWLIQWHSLTGSWRANGTTTSVNPDIFTLLPSAPKREGQP